MMPPMNPYVTNTKEYKEWGRGHNDGWGDYMNLKEQETR